MGGLVPKMYTKHKHGYLELELGDWKDNRMFRLGAIDHGQFSFVDQKHNSWPLVLVTNPKNAQYSMPGREPLPLIAESTHVRILAFSDVTIDTVKISYDSESWMKCRQKDGPLYVCQWLPNLFNSGLNYLHVTVTDEHGKETTIKHPFTIDGAVMNFYMTARILLMLDAGVVVRIHHSFLVLFTISIFLTKLFITVSSDICNVITYQRAAISNAEVAKTSTEVPKKVWKSHPEEIVAFE